MNEETILFVSLALTIYGIVAFFGAVIPAVVSYEPPSTRPVTKLSLLQDAAVAIFWPIAGLYWAVRWFYRLPLK